MRVTAADAAKVDATLLDHVDSVHVELSLVCERNREGEDVANLESGVMCRRHADTTRRGRARWWEAESQRRQRGGVWRVRV